MMFKIKAPVIFDLNRDLVSHHETKEEIRPLPTAGRTLQGVHS